VKRLFGAFIVLFLALSFSRLHGFSISAWDPYLAGDQEADLLGDARSIRSDDWVALVPALVAQSTGQNALQPRSDKLGYEAVNAMAMTPLPALSWQLAFRPYHWGYLFGSEIGIAWHWWFRIFLLLGSGFFLLSRWLPGQKSLGVLGALWIAYSPFFPFWGYCMEPVFGWALLAIGLTEAFFSETQPGRRRLWGLGLFYSFAALAFGGFYPAFQVPAIHLVLALMLGIYINRLRAASPPPSTTHRTLGALVAIGMLSVVPFALHLWFQRDTLKLVAETAYPGQRLSLGGQFSFETLWSNNFTLFSREIDWSHFGNICEAAGFLILLPATLILIFRRKLYRDARIAALLALLAFYHLRNFLGFPALLNVASGLSFVPENRTVALYGLGDVLLTLLSLALVWRQEISSDRRTWLVWVGAFAFWGALGALLLKGAPEFFNAKRVVTCTLGLGTITALLWTQRVRAFLIIVALLTVVKGIGFNPLVYRGLDKIRAAPLSQAVLTTPGCALWASFGNLVQPNYLRLLGIRNAGGAHFYPQFSFWTHFDPAGNSRSVYNRYAYTVFESASVDAAPSLTNPQPDIAVLRTHPDRPEWLSTGVDCLLMPKGDTQSGFKHWQTTWSDDSWAILKKIDR